MIVKLCKNMANLQKIKDLAEDKGISIRDLAERVGIKENQIHVMCRTNSTRIDTLEKIAQVLNVSISEFFDDTTIGGHIIKGDHNQLNERGSHNNVNSSDNNAILKERVRALEVLVCEKDERIMTLKETITEKDERIKELKERIGELKS